MEAAKYPDHNPFPIQATASIDAMAREDLSVAASVQTPQLRRTWDLVSAYLECRSGPNADSGILALYGPPGSGKTHTLRHVLGQAARRCTEAKRPWGQAYVLCDTSNAAALQRAVLKEIPLEVMRAVSRRFVEVIALEHVETQTVETKVGREERARLRENLSQIGELIKSALIDSEEVNKLQSDVLRKAGSEEFRNVISYLDDKDLGETARRWLCGDPVEPNDLLRLGAAKERSPDHARDALRVMIRLFQRSGTPFVLFLDQCENFLRSHPKGPLLQESVGALQRFAETLPKQQCLLAVATDHQTWKLLPDYLRQRFSLNAVSFSALSELDAREFVHTYVQGSPPAEGEDPSIFPFEEGAIKKVLESIRGNLRGFLQTCYQAFGLAFANKEPITSEIVSRALVEAKKERPSLEVVVEQAGAILRDRGLDHSGIPTAPGRASRVIQDRGGIPLALLEVSEALFIDDEARQSVTTLDVVKSALADARKLPVIVLIVGYASPEILEPLGRATPHVLVYDGENFRQRFSAILDQVQRASAEPLPILPILETRFSELRDQLMGLIATRTQDAQRTAGFAGEVVDKQEQNRIREQWRDARIGWSKERKNIEEQIRTARAQRVEQELHTLEWERSRAAKERMLRIGLSWAGLALLAGSIVVLLVFRDAWIDTGEYSRHRPPFYYWLMQNSSLLILPFVIVAFGAMAQLFWLGGAVRALWARVRSLEELDDLSARLARATPAATRHLFSNNPQLRYAAVRNITPTVFGLSRRERFSAALRLLHPVGPQDVRKAVEAEVNSTVRRSLVFVLT